MRWRAGSRGSAGSPRRVRSTRDGACADRKLTDLVAHCAMSFRALRACGLASSCACAIRIARGVRAPPHQHAQELTMYNDSKHGFDAVKTEYEAFMLEPHDWVPNNRKLPVVIYRHALSPHTGDLAAAF